jgi:hypothetical protein
MRTDPKLQTVIAARDEINKSAAAQIAELQRVEYTVAYS